MRLVNEVKDTIDLEGKNEETIYENFEEFMRTAFDRVTDLDWMNQTAPAVHGDAE